MPDISSSDRDLMIRTVVGESDDQPAIGQAGVAHVIMNRLKDGRWGDTPSSVVLARNQFEPWSTRARELIAIKPESDRYKKVASVVDDVLAGKIPDPTGGATHFLEPDIVRRRRGGSLPDWASGPGLRIADHVFYKPDDTTGTFGQATDPMAAIDAAIGAKPAATSAASSAAAPGSLFRGAGFDVPAVQSASPAPSGAAPAAAKPGSMFEAAGFKLPTETSAEPTGAAPAVLPVKIGPASYNVASEAEKLAKFGAGSGSVVEGMPIVGPLAQKGAAAINAAIDPLMGRGGDLPYGERYAKNLEIMRRSREIQRGEHPILSTVGNVAGAGALTAPLATAPIIGRALGTVGSTLGARVYGGLAGGTAIGATDAALRGEDPTTGAILGGVAGVGEWLANAMANETPASIAAARARMGPTGFAADINPSMTELAAGMAARAEPPASAQIGEAYRLRQAQQTQVIDQAVTRAMGPRTNILDARNMITADRRAAADPLYEQWRNTQVYPTPELKAMIPRLEAAGAFNQAEHLSGISGEPITRNFFTSGPRKEYPTTQTWDYVKRGLDSKIDQAYAGGDRTTARELVGLRGQLINEIERTPAGQVWRQARQEFAEHSQLLDQITAGQDTFIGGRSGVRADELREELRGLSHPELAARIQGARDAVTQAMGSAQNGDTTLRNRLLATNNQEKLRLLLGDQPANNLISTLRQQEFLGEQARYVNPRAGSPTAGRMQAAGALEAPPMGHWDPSLSRPLSWVPPAWVDALRPSTVIQGGRNASYAGARQQIAPALLTPEGRPMDAFLRAIQAETAGRALSAGRGAAAGRAGTLAITGPGSEELRKKKKLPNVRGVLSTEAR
jgi:hypothetical protein